MCLTVFCCGVGGFATHETGEGKFEKIFYFNSLTGGRAKSGPAGVVSSSEFTGALAKLNCCRVALGGDRTSNFRAYVSNEG